MELTFGSSCYLPPSAGIAVGFYGNGESSDGANRLAYSLRHANRTVSGVEKLVSYLPLCSVFSLEIKPTNEWMTESFFSLSPGVWQCPSFEPDSGGELGPVGDHLQRSDRLCVHRPKAAGTAWWAGEADGWCSFLVQHRHLPGGLGRKNRDLWLLQVSTNKCLESQKYLQEQMDSAEYVHILHMYNTYTSISIHYRLINIAFRSGIAYQNLQMSHSRLTIKCQY